jgi:protein LTV1
MPKQFIKKGEGKHYYLLHRSQTDAAYGGEETPSERVLVSSSVMDGTQKQVKNNDNKSVTSDRRSHQQDYESDSDDVSQISGFSFDTYSRKDHITMLGFKNDGYDYTQHMREMGGGRFIGKDGKMRDMPISNLPAEALPSDLPEMNRTLNAITIDHSVMDPDLAAALFDDVDENGEAFEELDDDFILQVAEEPDQRDDEYETFESHIANKIRESERRLLGMKDAPSNNWENLDDEEGEFEEYEEYEEYDDEDEQKLVSGKGKKKLTEKDFERMLEEYGDDDLGYIDNVDDEDINGHIELDGNNKIFEDALDDFIELQKSNQVVDPSINFKEENAFIKSAKYWDLDEVPDVAPVRELYTEQSLLQKVLEEENKESVKLEESGVYKELETCQEYLREVRITEDYDCESIISTYSTLDNHPSLIKEPSKYKPYKSNYQKLVDAQASGVYAEHANGATKPAKAADIRIGSGVAARITLKGKHSLPVVSKGTKEEVESDESSDSDSDNDNTVNSVIVRPKNETKEEKKLRKESVKQQKREKRIQKKALKQVYNNESMKQIKSISNQQDINGVSVFKLK